jgi:predicted dehydrogenase
MKLIRVLLIGAGGIAYRHAAALNSFENVIFDIYDPYINSINKKIQIMNNFGYLIKNLKLISNYSGLIVCSPTNTHLFYLKKFSRLNIPILVEKPLSIPNESFKKLNLEIFDNPKLFGVAFPRVFSKGYIKIKEIIDSDVLGRIRLINLNFSQDFRKFRPDYQKTYYAKIESGGGFITDALSHHINLIDKLIGMPTHVLAMSDRMVLENVEGEDMSYLLLKYQDGLAACLRGNQFQKPNEDSIEVIGENGSIKYDRINGILSVYDCKTSNWNNELLLDSWDEIIKNQIFNFLNVIEKKAIFHNSIIDGVNNLKIILAAKKSIKMDKWIAI